MFKIEAFKTYFPWNIKQCQSCLVFVVPCIRFKVTKIYSNQRKQNKKDINYQNPNNKRKK